MGGTKINKDSSTLLLVPRENPLHQSKCQSSFLQIDVCSDLAPKNVFSKGKRLGERQNCSDPCLERTREVGNRFDPCFLDMGQVEVCTQTLCLPALTQNGRLGAPSWAEGISFPQRSSVDSAA